VAGSQAHPISGRAGGVDADRDELVGVDLVGLDYALDLDPAAPAEPAPTGSATPSVRPSG